MRTWIGAGLIAATALTAPAFGQSFSGLYVFGDSLSDNGNLFRLTGQPPAPYFQGRFSNGPTYAERLPGLLGFTYTPSTNYAVGGALTDTSHNAGLPNLGMQAQVNNFLASGRSFNARDLVVVWGGANDYFATLTKIATQTPTQAQGTVSTQITSTITNLAGEVQSLIRAGAREIIVPNLPFLGATPSIAATGATGVGTANLITTNHNANLATTMGTVGRGLGANIYVIDTAALFTDMQTNPSKYGLSNVTAQCIQTAACVGGSAATQAQYLFWDGVHPTAAVHQIYAAYVAANLTGPATQSAPGRLAQATARGFDTDISARQHARRGGAGGASLTGSALPGSSQTGDKDKPFAVFVSANYGWGDRDANATEAGLDYTDTSFTVGADYRLGSMFLVGGALGYGMSDGKLSGGLGKVEANSFRGALYASLFDGAWYIDAAATAGMNDFNKLTRNTGFVGAPSLSADTEGRTVTAGLEAGYLFKFGDFAVGPLAGMRYSVVSLDGYTESGFAGVARQIDKQRFTSLVARAGVQASYKLTADGATIVPRASAVVEQELNDSSRTITSRIVSQPGVTQSVKTKDADSTVLRLSAGVAAGFGDRYTVSLDGDTSFGGDGRDNRVLGRLRVAF
ncbi:autotransporter domain-containing protein [Elstera cyanobacteriorum]|uniref:autotransporter domain-containing protein n=1 Tax=Elstera cyanobacteriorum TaxID=2022747 RepID=UPI00235665E7|nr:autotransporter domain-containing protein [Elstera cyanobacteriorum]MCK6442773.1 autotransporter domain-containing protein [Elstera cyanobacteriorum]